MANICANLKTAAALGYDGLEVHIREDAELDYNDILKAMTDTGIKIATIATGRLNTQGKVDLIDDRPFIVDAAMNGIRKYLQMAAKLNTDLIVGWIKGCIPNGAEAGRFIDRLARNLTLICREAADLGVKVFLEVINHYETNIMTTAKELITFLDTRRIPNCYVHLDTFHMNIEETNSVEAIRLCGKWLGYFHVADNTRLYPGSGSLDFKSYFTVLENIGYEGYVSVECFPLPDGRTAAEKAIAHLRQCERQ